MNISGLVRLTKDAEMATTQSGKQVLKISAAFDTGYGDSKKTTWVDASFWGERGIKLAPYLLKGTQIVIHGDQVEANAYQGKSGLQSSLRMNVVNIELVARAQGEQAPKPQYTPQPSLSAPPANDFHNDEIPW